MGNVIKTYVAGVRHKNEDGRSIQELLSTITYKARKAGPLSAFVLRDPDNQYDDNAIAVYLDGSHIGYVPKHLAEELAPRMDAGDDLNVISMEIEEKGDEYFCNLTLEWQQEKVEASETSPSKNISPAVASISKSVSIYQTKIIDTDQNTLRDALGMQGKYELHLTSNSVEVLFAKPQSGGLFQRIGRLPASAAHKIMPLLKERKKLTVSLGKIYQNDKTKEYVCEIDIVGVKNNKIYRGGDMLKYSAVSASIYAAIVIIIGFVIYFTFR